MLERRRKGGAEIFLGEEIGGGIGPPGGGRRCAWYKAWLNASNSWRSSPLPRLATGESGGDTMFT